MMYTIAQIEALTGISDHNLRIWERRFSFIDPARSSTNIRQYSDKDLRKLLNIGILLQNGNKVSVINKLAETEIKDKVKELFESKVYAHSSEINAFVLSMLELDEEKFHQLFDLSVTNIGFIKTVVEILYPFLSRVGGLWTTEEIVPAEEHFVSSLVRQKLISAIDKIPQPKEADKSILLFLPQDEKHELGLLLASYMARELNWKVFYFGQNLPINNLPALTKKLNPTYLLTFFILPRANRAKEMMEDILVTVDTPLLVSGNSINFEEKVQNVQYLSSPYELLQILSK